MSKVNTVLQAFIALAFAGLTATSVSAAPFTIRVSAPVLRPNLSPSWAVTGSPTTAFASANIGNYATPDLTISVINSGSIGSLGALALTGANPGDFSTTNNCTNIATNAACAVSVRFKPLASGSRSASMTIAGTPLNFTGTGLVVPAGPFNFSTCGNTGPNGPAQSQCNTTYSSSSLAGLVSVSGGIQSWTVPVTATYTVVVAGAVGGSATGNTGFGGGLGAVLSTQVSLTQGTVLKILVGQAGSNVTYSAGGGGGTYVISGSTPLAVAGGGGGGNYNGGVHAANASPDQTLTNNTSWNGTTCGYSGGAGFVSNGNGTQGGCSYSGFGTAYSFQNGGAGAQVHDNSYAGYDAFGGFGGGGGGGYANGGSGGGYTPTNIGSGNGGNSYSLGSLNSSSSSNSGAGYVTITKN